MASMHCYKPAQKSYYQEQEEFSYSEEETANWSLNGHRSHHGGFQGYAQKESYIESDRSQYLNNGMNKSHARYGYGQADYPNGCNAHGNQYFGYDKAVTMAEGGEGMGQAYGNHKKSHGMMIYEEKTEVKGKFNTGQVERIILNRSDDSCSDSDSECDGEYRGRRKHHCR
ncbi:hypothetical protein SLA2020_401870 [Shorea laevis]